MASPGEPLAQRTEAWRRHCPTLQQRARPFQWPQYSPPVSQGIPSRRQCQSQCRGTSLGSRGGNLGPRGSQTPQSPLGRHLEQAEFQSAGRLHLGTAGQCAAQRPLLGPHTPGSGLTLKAPKCVEGYLTGVCGGGGAARAGLEWPCRGRQRFTRTLLPGAGVEASCSPTTQETKPRMGTTGPGGHVLSVWRGDLGGAE